MTPGTKRAKTTDGAMRAAKQIEHDPSFIESTAEIIDRETGVRELVDMLENIIAGPTVLRIDADCLHVFLVRAVAVVLTAVLIFLKLPR